MTIRLGRWSITVTRRAVWLTQTPRRDCPDCQGAGGQWTPGPFPDMDACDCWRDPIRIPLRRSPRRRITDEQPF